LTEYRHPKGFYMTQHLLSDGRSERNMPAAPAATADLLPLGEFLRIALRHKWILVLCVLAGAVGSVLYGTQSVPLYQSKGQVLVAKTEPRNFAGVGAQMSALEDDIGVHLALLTSPVFIRQAVEHGNLRALPTFADTDDPTGEIKSSLTVTRESTDPTRISPGASIVTFAYRGPQPADCPVVVSAMIQSYQEFLDKTSRKLSEEALSVITRKAESVRQEIRVTEAKYQEFRKRAPLLTPSRDGISTLQGRIADIETRKADLALRRASAENRIAAVRRAVAAGADNATLMAIVAESNRKDSYTAMEAALFPLLLKEKTLLEDFGPGHPEVLAVRKQIALVNEFYAPSSPTRTGLASPAGELLDTRQQATVKTYTESLQHELAEVETAEKTLAKLTEEQNAKAKETQSYESEDRQLSGEIARLEQYYQSLMQQLHNFDLSKELVGYSMEVFSPPLAASQVAPRWVWVLGISLSLGLLAGVGIAYLMEVSDRSFHSPHEVTRRLGLPVVAHIPLLPGPKPRRPAIAGGRILDPILCTYYQPASPEAEAYRGLRTALYFSTHGERFKVIQVTSPNSGDGKTAMIANLAVSLAQLGRRVLLVDADLRWPRLHAIFGLACEVGLASVINGEAEPHDAILRSDIPGLWILPGGPIPPNPADLLTSPRFKELLDHVRDQYDFVLVDTPALLAVTDPRIVAPRVDGVLLAIRVTKNGRPRVERCREILGTLEANLLGVVVNVKDRHRHYESDAFEDYHTGYPYCSDGNGETAQHSPQQRAEEIGPLVISSPR
jgi:polysaccharide biosynthesis transport protein